jgi:hypothetical protein
MSVVGTAGLDRIVRVRTKEVDGGNAKFYCNIDDIGYCSQTTFAASLLKVRNALDVLRFALAVRLIRISMKFHRVGSRCQEAIYIQSYPLPPDSINWQTTGERTSPGGLRGYTATSTQSKKC